MSCSICDNLPASTRDPLPEAAWRLAQRESLPEIGGGADLWECPECGLHYVFTVWIGSYAHMIGDGGEQTLDRLTRTQSDVVSAMLACTADPPAVEDTLFALPDIAFRLVLARAYAKDRDFIALFIPRLVHTWAARTHDTGTVVMNLAEQQPSYAREVLAAATSLPPELRDKLGDLESRCQTALA